MKWPVIIRPNAETDLLRSQIWYESQRAGLRAEFRDEIRLTISILEMYPERRPIYYRGFRRLLTRRFPYKIFYRNESDCVIIFRVLHAKRNHPRKLGN